MRLRAPALACLAAVVCAAPAAAQFRQFSPPGDFEERRESIQAVLERAIKGSRWKLGRTYLDPWLSLRDVAVVDNVRSQSAGPKVTDLTATAGAGLRLYRPIGQELTFAAHALPEYVWWRDLDQRRRWNGRYGAGLFGNLGRTGLEISVRRIEDSEYFSREVEERVNSRYDNGFLSLEVELGGGVSLFGSGSVSRFRYLPQGEEALEDIDLLDRDEQLYRIGIRFTFTDSLTAGVGVERSQVEFAKALADRSNSGDSPVLEIAYDGTRFDLRADLVYRDLEPEPESSFVPFQGLTGQAQLALRRAARAEVQLFADRDLVYTVDPGFVYFEDQGAGIAVRTSLGARASVRLFGERGRNDYLEALTGRTARSEDYEAFGADLRVRLGRATLILSGSETSYESALPGADRTVRVVRGGLTFGRGGDSPWG